MSVFPRRGAPRAFAEFAMLFAASATQAQTPNPAQPQNATVQLPPVQVTDQRRPELQPESALNPFRTPQSSTNHTEIITREQIEALRPQDPFDLLNRATGVVSTQSGRKGFSGLLIRGDSNFRWIIDGALLQPTMAARIVRNLPVSIIEEIKIVRGSTALTLGPLVGSASPGGAPVDGFVIIRTRKPTSRELELRIATESNGTFQTTIWAGNTFEIEGGGKGYIAGLPGYGRTDGPGARLDNGASYNVGYHTYSGLAKAGVSRDNWALDLTTYQDWGMFRIPNANSHGPGQGSWYVDPTHTTMLIASGSVSWSPVHTTLVSLSHIRSGQYLWTANTASAPHTAAQNDNFLTHLNLRHNMDIDRTRVMIGGDFLHWNTPNGQQYYEGIPREERTLGGFAQVEQSLFDDRLTLDAAVRVDQVNVLRGLDYYTAGAAPFGGVNSPLRTRNRVLPLAKFVDVGGSWKFIEDWKLTARVSGSTQGVSGLNPRPGVTLQDDSQFKVELGIEGRVHRMFNPAINFFHRAVQNEKTLAGYTYLANNNTSQVCRIGTVPSTGPLSPKTASALTPCYNQANTTRQGIEVTVWGGLWERGSYRASFTHFTNLQNASAITPRNIGELMVQQWVGDFILTGAIKYVASYKGSATDPWPWLGGYTRFDVGIGYDFRFGGTDVRTTVFGRNLTDRRYETTDGIQNVGRTIGAELLARF